MSHARNPILATGLLAASALLLPGCVAGPRYAGPPAVATGHGWAEAGVDTAPVADLSRWWATLGDPVLARLVETALAQNLDLRQASARIEEARALRDRAIGRQFPVIGAGASVNQRRQSENGPLPVGAIPGLTAAQTIFDVGFDAAWEADLAGGQRQARIGATARLDATRIEAEAVRVRIAAEVARNWFDAGGAGEELKLQRATVASLRRTLMLTRQRAALGDAPAAEIDAVAGQLAAAEALVPGIAARQRAALLALGPLLGSPPERELAPAGSEAKIPELPELPVGERAELLRRRPDVLAAERRLAASTADIGVATAELFPKLAISAGGGFQALETGNWFDASSGRFSILPFLSWRLFDGGRVRAEIRAAKARERQAALAYEQAVLQALEDAERSLGQYHAGLDALARQQQALESERRSLGHAEARLAAGETPRLDLLAAERRLYTAETATIRARTDAAIRLVTLYKALGGGWNAPVTDRQTANMLPVHSGA